MSRIALVFPGQGAQKPGMGQDFYEQFPEAKAIYDLGSEKLGVDLAQISFTEDPRLNLTEFTQPAILTMEVAALAVLEKTTGLKGDIFAGHSLGEYSALVAAGALRYEDAVQIVRRRGALMQNAVPEGKGAMLALLHDNIESLGLEQKLSSTGVTFANFNSLAQIVLSGSREGIEEAEKIFTAEFPAGKAIRLNVSAPFHSTLMQPIEDEFMEYLKSFSAHIDAAKAATVLSNFSGTFHESATFYENLVKQISGSVRWVQNMRVIKDAAETVWEIGPNRVLGKFFTDLEVNAGSIINVRAIKKSFPDANLPRVSSE